MLDQTRASREPSNRYVFFRGRDAHEREQIMLVIDRIVYNLLHRSLFFHYYSFLSSLPVLAQTPAAFQSSYRRLHHNRNLSEWQSQSISVYHVSSRGNSPDPCYVWYLYVRILGSLEAKRVAVKRLFQHRRRFITSALARNIPGIFLLPLCLDDGISHLVTQIYINFELGLPGPVC